MRVSVLSLTLFLSVALVLGGVQAAAAQLMLSLMRKFSMRRYGWRGTKAFLSNQRARPPLADF